MSNEASYLFGQCTYWVAKNLDWVPSGWGDAKDWLGHAQEQGYNVTDSPTPGSVVVYNAGGQYSPFGHVGFVESLNGDGTFNVSEMNYRGWNVDDVRRSDMSDVAGFILKPGEQPSPKNVFDPTGGRASSVGFGSKPGPVSVPGLGGIGQLTANANKVLGWTTDRRNWWKVAFIAVGGWMILTGAFVYFIKEEAPGIERAAGTAAKVAA